MNFSLHDGEGGATSSIKSLMSVFAPLLAFISLLGLTACTTLEVGVAYAPTQDRSVVSTLASLMVEGTQEAAMATQIALQPTPLPAPGLVSGRVCYPSEHTPSMIAYFRSTTSEWQSKLQIMASQATYQVTLPPGEYLAYAWATSYQVGGMYTKAVTCGLTEGCDDHSPQPFTVLSGQTTSGIDLCDWVIPVDQLPIPSGTELPGP